MRTVHKVLLPVSAGTFAVSIQDKAELIHVDAQGRDDIVMLWFEVDTGNPLVSRKYTVTGTGHPVREGLYHVGSCVTPNKSVWHVWE